MFTNIYYVGDIMRIICNIIKKFCVGIFSLYSINLFIQYLNINIPINIFTIFMSSFLGVFGIVSIIILKIFI
mgnify:CR=1 FL=1